jgi:recombination protein RecT
VSNELATIKTNLFRGFDSPQMHTQLADVLPPEVSPKTFIAVLKSGIVRNPDILNCTQQSIYQSAERCAQDGLRLDGREAALVKMGNVAQYMPMVSGLRKIAAKYNITIDAQVVRESDVFKVWRDEKGVHFNHEPSWDSSPVKLVYASARLPSGETMLEVMTREQVEVIRQVSRAKNSGPWVSHWDEMARKTVTRRLWKQLPFYSFDGGEAAERVAEAIDAEYANDQPAQNAAPQQTRARASALDVVAAAADEHIIEGQADEVASEEPVAQSEAPIRSSADTMF